MYAPLIKHPKFKEEGEWKIFASYFPDTKGPTSLRFFMKEKGIREQLEFREGKGSLEVVGLGETELGVG